MLFFTINWQPKSTPLSNKAFKILNLFEKAGEKSLFSIFLNEYCETNSPTILGKNNEWPWRIKCKPYIILYMFPYIGLHNNYGKSQSMLWLHYWGPLYPYHNLKAVLGIITYGLIPSRIKSKKGNLKNAICIEKGISRYWLVDVYNLLTDVHHWLISTKVYIDTCVSKFSLTDVYHWLVSTRIYIDCCLPKFIFTYVY